jgi:1,4-dihydroxy-2-naphthoyl-CoA hydrolase
MAENATFDPKQAAEIANRQVAEGAGGTMIPNIGIEYLEVGPDRTVARLPVERNTQPYGLLHGGATAALCETIGSLGTAVAVGLDKIVTGIELNVNHLRGVRAGYITGVGIPVHMGRTTAVWDIRVQDDDDRLVAVGRLTLVIRDPQPG